MPNSSSATSRQLRILRTPARPDHPRHPPQDRGPASTGGGVRPAAWPRHADPLAAAAPARLEALFLPCPRGRVHRQGQGQRALRVRREGLHRHHQSPGSRRPVRAARQGAARQPLRRPHLAGRHRRHRDAHRLSRSSAPMSTRDTAATTRKIPVASSSPARSAASSASSSASCAAAPPSSPSSDT